MSINVNAKQDYSFLFSSLGNGASGVGGSNFLGDYMAIKNGSYGKLMRAYYGTSANDSVKTIANNSTSKTSNLTSEDKKAYAKVETAADALKDSADALLATGSKSLFNEKDITTTDEKGVETTKKGYDTNAIYKAVNSFVTNYNETLKAAANVDDKSVTSRVNSMMNNTRVNERMLNKIGVTVNDDGSLSLDKDIFMKSDMKTVKNIFNGNGSYGYQTSAQASLINYAADHASSRSGFYSTNGNYSNSFNSGNLFNDYF